jgi:malic enzyme
LREVSRAIAIAVAEQARECGVADLDADDDVATRVSAAMWMPGYRAESRSAAG